jgi:diguanylate cyclase (GGDEF)-like protein/PAS domain S-box-containing protein
MRIASIILVLILGSQLASAASGQAAKVLLLHSYHAGQARVADLEQGLKETLAADGTHIDFYIEHMDTKRLPYTLSYQRLYFDYLQGRYRNRAIDLILTTDDNAFNFMRRYGDILFPDKPVVFSGVDKLDIKALAQYPSYSGIQSQLAARETVDLALQLHPETRQLYIINDHLPTGRAWQAAIDQQLAGLENQLRIEHIEPSSMVKLEQQLASLPEQSLVLLGIYARDSDDVFYNRQDSTRRIAAASNAPVYGLEDLVLGHGVVGGKMLNGYRQGAAMARRLQAILAGKSAGQAVIKTTADTPFMFDAVELNKKNITVASLPANSTVINQDKVKITAAERLWLQQHPIIRLAPDGKFQPFEYFDDNGNYHGIAADMLALIEQKLGITFTVVQLDSWQQILDAIKARKIDMLGAASPTEERRSYLRFTAPLLDVPTVIIGRSSEQAISLDSLKGKRVAAIPGYVSHNYLQQHHPLIELLEVPDIKTALRMVSFGKVEATVVNLATASFYFHQLGITNLKVFETLDTPWQNSIAVRSDWPELQSILNKGLDMITDQERTEIMQRWLKPLESSPWWHLSLTQLYSLGASLAVLLFGALILINFYLRSRVHQQTQDLQVTNQKLSDSEEKYRAIFENAEDPMAIMDGQKIVLANIAAARFFGYGSTRVLKGRAPWEFLPLHQPDGVASRDFVHRNSQKALLEGYYRFEATLQHRNQQPVDAEVAMTHIPYEGQPALFVTWHDIRDRKRMQAELLRLATHDTLTGLASLRLIEDRIEVAIANAQRQQDKSMAVLFIDLDGFKAINDNYGHHAGDAILKEVATRMLSTVRKADTVARIGGDELLVLVSGIHAAKDAEQVAEKLVHNIRQPFEFQGHSLQVGASLGIAIYPEHGSDGPALIEAADQAMYLVKRSGKNHYRLAGTDADNTDTLA